MGKCIAIYNRKGGVGKSCIAENIAAQLAVKGNKVLLIDNDSQINMTQFFLRFNEEYFDGNQMLETTGTIYDILEGKKTPEDVIVHLHYEVRRRMQNKNRTLSCDLDLIPGSKMMDYYGTEEYFQMKNSLRETFEKYDYIFIDCPPANNVATMLAMVASDYLLVPIDPGDEKSVDGYSDVLDRCMEAREEGSDVTILGTFFNRFMPRKADQAAMYEELLEEENLNAMKFFAETIRYSYNDVHLSEMEQVPICMIQGNGIPPIVKEIDTFVDALIHRIEEVEANG